MVSTYDGFKFLIADDHPAILIGLSNIMEAQKPKSLFEARDGDAALEIILKEKPDLAILDVFMPKKTGMEVLKELCKKNSRTKVVLFTAHIDKEMLDDALKYGARGYLLKDSAGEELLKCVNFVLDDGIYISPHVTQKLLIRMWEDGEGKEAAGGRESILNYLSDTEKKILLLLAENMTSKEIASKLDVSYRTVQNHRANMCSKLNINGANALLLFAVKHKEKLHGVRAGSE